MKDMKGLTLLTLWRNPTDTAMARCMADGGARVLVLCGIPSPDGWGTDSRAYRAFRKEMQRTLNVTVIDQQVSHSVRAALAATAGAGFEPSSYAYLLAHVSASVLGNNGNVMLTNVAQPEFGTDWFDRFQRVWMALQLDMPRPCSVFFYDVNGKQVTTAFPNEEQRTVALQGEFATAKAAQSPDGSYERLREDGLQPGFQRVEEPVLQAEAGTANAVDQSV